MSLVYQCKTVIAGRSIVMRFPKARKMQEAINAMAQHVKEITGIDILESRCPLDIKLVPGHNRK